MSSFMCDNTQITIIASAYVHVVLSPSENEKARHAQIERIALQLHSENAAAMRELYREESHDPFALDTAAIGCAYAALDLMKSITCYRYQACESSEWKTSDAHDITSSLIVALVRYLPGFEQSEAWGAPSPVSPTTRGVVRL